MGFRLLARDALPILHLEFFDEVTAATVVDALDCIVAHVAATGMPGPHNLLWDACAVTRLVIRPEDMASIDTALRAFQVHLPSGRSAALTRPGQFDPYSFAMLFTAKASATDARERALFTNADAACAWLTGGQASTG